jgi:hypothetical protein
MGSEFALLQRRRSMLSLDIIYEQDAQGGRHLGSNLLPFMRLPRKQLGHIFITVTVTVTFFFLLT